MKKLISTTVMIAVFTTLAFSQETTKTDSLSLNNEKQVVKWRHYVGSSLFLLGNIGDDFVKYFQLNYGYRLTQKDNLIAELITWGYKEPLGTYMSSDAFYPGYVRAYGLGLGYQRFLWKNLYTTVEPTFFLQQFYDTYENEIQRGFQLYLQFHLGYRFEFFNKRLFAEPAIALKYWPVNTNFPAAFAAIESGKPKYKFEPSLNIGVRF